MNKQTEEQNITTTCPTSYGTSYCYGAAEGQIAASPPIRSILAVPGENAQVMDAAPYHANLQRLVQCARPEAVGVIGTFDINVYCDMNGKKNGKPFNRKFCGIDFYGPILVNGMHKQDRPLTDEEVTHLLQELNNPLAMSPNHGARGKQKGGPCR